MKLILFDIDGTLISTGGAGTRALALAFKKLFSINNAFRDISMAGKTDPQIVREGLAKHNIHSDNGVLPRVINTYLEYLKAEMKNERKHIKSGIKTALDTLSNEINGYYLGLLTGNLEQGARIKLGPFDLNKYFQFGAFGSDDEDRNKLLPIAVGRFKNIYRKEIDFKDCIIVGDTPRDVYCAKPYGAFCIGVATGPYPADALVEAGADVVMKNLADTNAFLELINKI